jgi:lipopolysaccharide transport system ATP-binding protein
MPIDEINSCGTKPDEVLVKVHRVSKKFCRDLKKSLWYGAKDVVNELNPFGKSRTSEYSRTETLRPAEFWANKDISFELRRGECLGLIGRNGAGKTTLLKMLNGLIKPDTGSIEMKGRVGALIALGAGFNPILTGRENILVNGSILGLNKNEISEKIEGIIDFAEIREFIDAPVQSYSSGMQVRLGFAVATALNPDILILDEVLAVGDAAFRAKCYARLSEIAANAAIIFVSHNMEQVGQICNKAVVMKSGILVYCGNAIEGIEKYNIINSNNSIATGEIHTSKLLAGISADLGESLSYGGNLQLKFKLTSPISIPSVDVKISIFDEVGIISESYTKSNGETLSVKQGFSEISLAAGPFFLKQGFYRASVVLLNRDTNEHLFWADRAFQIKSSGPSFGNGFVFPPIVVRAC